MTARAILRASPKATRSTQRYYPYRTSAAAARIAVIVHSPTSPGKAGISAVAASLARPVMVATATTIWRTRVSQTAQLRGPGRRANPSRRGAPARTAYRPISLLMNHLSETAAIRA